MRRAWRPGDLLLVDNVLAAHGRDPFRGARKIVVAMGDPTPLADCRPTPPLRLPATTS
ncbi:MULTISPECIES: TauD/TfdA family dioxygenase [unclassified Streptomyces]|uniref:TauD/TfdA family dioxygenase n=1 Tax=unclassified Streptomyces TaxID=2593676 RepID=UPI001F5B9309|nr:TauD/TfdA family dioxygenase [Streptomyces sp. HSG2]